MRGHVIRYNYLHHLSGLENRGCEGIYLDDMFSGTTIYGNVLYRVGRFGCLLGGGRDIVTTNNFFIACGNAIQLDDRALNWAAFSLPAVIAGLESMPYREEPWASRYPELVNILDDEPAVPKGNVVARNVVYGNGFVIYEAARKTGRIEDNLTVDTIELRDQIILQEADAKRAQELGIEPIDLKEIGLLVTPLRRRRPPRWILEIDLEVEVKPVFDESAPQRAGILLTRVRNRGDQLTRFAIALQIKGGHFAGPALVVGYLKSHEIMEQRLQILADSAEIVVTVVDDKIAIVPTSLKIT